MKTSNNKFLFQVLVFLGITGCDTDKLHKSVMDSYDIKVSIAKGANIFLKESDNPIIIFDGESSTRYNKNIDVKLQPDEYYVYCLMKRKKPPKRVYFIDLLIEDSPLKGSKIRIGDAMIQKSLIGYYQTLHKIKSKSNLSEKELKFRILSIRQK